MRFLSWLFSLAVFAATVVFVLQNRMQVTISFWPFDAQATLPVSILSLGLLIFGFLAGAGVAGALNIRWVFENRRLKREVEALKAKAQKQAEAAVPCSGPTILSHGRYNPVPPLPPEEPRRRRFCFFKRKKT